MTGAPRGLPRTFPRSARARALVVAVALIFLGGVVFLAWPRANLAPTPASASATPPRVPIAVSVGHRDGVPVVAGIPTTFTAHALAEAPIASLELWAGDERVAVQDADSASPALHARWEWAPPRAGKLVVFARAVDAVGRVRQSNAVRVDVLPGAGEASAPRITLAGAPVRAHPSLALPAVQAEVEGCTVGIEVSDLASAAGFTVYQLPHGGFSFVPLTSLAANLDTTSVDVPAAGGASTFVVGVFDATVEVLADPITLVVPEDCDPDGWSGGVALDGGVLVGGPPVERAYLYLQQGDDAARRIPGDPGSFVEAHDGVLDFGDHLPTSGAEAIHIEAWGWQGGTLVDMGAGTWTPPATGGGSGGSSAALAPGALLGAGAVTSLDVAKPVTVAGPAPCGKEFCTIDLLVKQDDVVWPTQSGNPSPERTLRWSTLVPSVDRVVWQILPYAPSATADLDPPFVVDQGVVEVEPGTSSGEFTIDMADYLGPGVLTADFVGQPPDVAAVQPVFALPGASNPTPKPSPTPASGGGGGSSVGNVAQGSIGQIVPSSIGNQAYIRIIPMQGTTMSIASNHVRLDIVPPPEQIKIDAPVGYGENKKAYSVDWSFTPPKAADAHFARCAVVTGFTDGYVPPPWLWPYTYDIGDVFCYTPPNDDDLLDVIEDGFEAFVDLVEDVWEGIGEGYAWIQDQIVKVILATVPCQAIASDAVCETIAKTALSVALASLGIPPTIPDFGAVMNGLKGDLRTLVLEAAKTQFPAVEEACGLAAVGAEASSKLASCEAMVDEAIDEIVAQVEQQVSDAAGGATGKAYPGVIFAPDPRGIYQPPTVTMTITRTSDPVLPVECTATVAMESTKTNHTWQELIAGWPKTATGTVKGQPFLAESFTIPPMQPGESITRTVWLSDPATWFESQDAWEYEHYYEALANANHAYQLLTAGSSLVFKVSGNCMPNSQQGPHVLTQSAID